MEVTIRQEAGYNMALYGFSLSYKDRAIKPEDWWYFATLTNCIVREDGVQFSFTHQGGTYCTKMPCDKCPLYERISRIKKATKANAGRGNGHDKFLRQIVLWVDIEAPRYWWSEFDTYKVGTVAQSESTMHTLTKRDLDCSDFQDMEVSPRQITLINKYRKDPERSLELCKKYLPEGYLQRRMVTLNYGVLHTIINQRKNHRLKEWAVFIKEIYQQVEHPELLPEYPYK